MDAVDERRRMDMTDIRTDDIGFGNLKLLQNPSEFCYGVDAVILADFAASICGSYRYAADLGTGTGIIPFILHHKVGDAESRCFGLDFNEGAVALARESSRLNGLDRQIRFGCGDVGQLAACSGAAAVSSFPGFAEEPAWQDVMAGGGFDLVTSNPPYFAKGSAIPGGSAGKFRARHETTTDLDGFVQAAAKILKRRGQLFLVHRPSRLVDIFESCRRCLLEPKTIRFVVPEAGQAPNIVLVHCVLGGELKYLPQLAVYDGHGNYSREIRKIYERDQDIRIARHII